MNIPTIVVSGGFDPMHRGHVQMIREASHYGNVVVVLNSDEWLIRKKGYKFMSFEERAFILGNIKGVSVVTNVLDGDDTVCEALRRIKPDYFANGGDRHAKSTPESVFCKNNSIETLWGIGGENKSNSSSWILKQWKEK